jgi:hypothetical protein
METISDGYIDNIYQILAQEQTAILTKMKCNPESFKQNERLHSHLGIILKDLLKYKMLREKIKLLG